MKKFISLIFLLIVLGIYAFSKVSINVEHIEMSFPNSENLHGKTIPIDTALFRYPYRYRVNADRVIIEDLHGLDYYFHLFTYPDFRYLSSFGQRGQGPEEMLTVDDCRWDGNTFWGLDNIKSELVGWVFNEKRDRMVRKEQVKLDKATFRAISFVFYKDNTILIPNYSGDTRFCEVDKNGRLMKKWGNIPTDKSDMLKNKPNVFGQGWASMIDFSLNNGVLVAATQLGEVLEVWNTKKNTYQILKGKMGEPKFEIYQNYAIPSGCRGYNDIQITKDAIYAIFAGDSFKDLINNTRKGQYVPEGGKIVRVFSLEGKPLKEYKLDHSVSGIWVDEKLDIMWALDVNSDEPIVKYALKK